MKHKYNHEISCALTPKELLITFQCNYHLCRGKHLSSGEFLGMMSQVVLSGKVSRRLENISAHDVKSALLERDNI